MMAMFFAQRVILGKTTFANVPKALKAGVVEVLIDSGLPVLSMHAPQEIINKADLFEAVKAYRAFMIEG